MGLTSQSAGVVASNGILAVLAICAVTLRVSIRRGQQKKGLKIDDYLIFVALVSFINDPGKVLFSHFAVLLSRSGNHQYRRRNHRWLWY